MTERLTPAEVFPPGDFIKEEMEERGWSQADLAHILSRPVQTVNEILSGKKSITPETARELAAAFGNSPELFLNLENAYRLFLAPGETSKVSRRAKLYGKAPVRELIKRGWIRGSSDIGELEKQVRDFLGVKSLDDDPPCAFAARKSDGYDEYSPGQIAWFCRCRQLALGRLPSRPFDARSFRAVPPTLPKEYADIATLDRLPAQLARRGVILVLLEHLPGTKIDGGAFWVEGHPVVALSLRYDRVDSFWFTLLHELAHIVLHKELAVLDVDLVGPTAAPSGEKPATEQEADRKAQEWLVPEQELVQFIRETSPYYSHDRIARFAEQLGVHVGVLVGRLQHRGEIGWGHSRKYLVKVRHLLPLES